MKNNKNTKQILKIGHTYIYISCAYMDVYLYGFLGLWFLKYVML